MERALPPLQTLRPCTTHHPQAWTRGLAHRGKLDGNEALIQWCQVRPRAPHAAGCLQCCEAVKGAQCTVPGAVPCRAWRQP